MTDVHEGLEPKKFELSGDVVAIEFCTETGLAVGSNCTSTETGYYKENAKPGICESPHGSTDEEGDESSSAGGGGSNSGGGGSSPLDATTIE